MKRILLVLAFLWAGVSAYGQGLKLLNFYPKEAEGMYNGVPRFGLTTANKPNGYMYRLRQEVKASFLPATTETANLEMFISEKTDFGCIALFRTPMGSDDYKFIVVLYNDDEEILKQLDLVKITGVDNCELQDIRYADGCIYFNMACPSYSSQIGGKGSRLYCVDVDSAKIKWQTDYLVSNDILILYGPYVICGYGFTSEKDYLYLVDRFTGKIYAKEPLKSKASYLEVINTDLYVVDYQGSVYEFRIDYK